MKFDADKKAVHPIFMEMDSKWHRAHMPIVAGPELCNEKYLVIRATGFPDSWK